ncbi:hypothetical protein C8R47DRAFT_1209667 [Mycena vitilis]|nr:hypothetical protein C8R47DRAFT_1209667 [Mycena vitilis]
MPPRLVLCTHAKPVLPAIRLARTALTADVESRRRAIPIRALCVMRFRSKPHRMLVLVLLAHRRSSLVPTRSAFGRHSDGRWQQAADTDAIHDTRYTDSLLENVPYCQPRRPGAWCISSWIRAPRLRCTHSATAPGSFASAVQHPAGRTKSLRGGDLVLLDGCPRLIDPAVPAVPYRARAPASWVWLSAELVIVRTAHATMKHRALAIVPARRGHSSDTLISGRLSMGPESH